MARNLEANNEIYTCAAIRLRDLAAVSEYGNTQILDCNACNGDAVMNYEGSVSAPQCKGDTSCQRSAVELHPDLYFSQPEQEAGTIKQLDCDNCGSAISALACRNEVVTELEGAGCRLDTSAIVYWVNGRDLLNNMKLENTAADSVRISTNPVQGCIGRFVSRFINDGLTLEPGNTYTCPLSADSGEHCRSQLTVDSAGNLVTGDEAEAWEHGCLVEREELSEDELAALDRNW